MKTTMEKTLNVRLPEVLHSQLTKLTQVTGRTKSYLTIEALADYIAYQTWQIEQVELGVKQARNNEFASEEKMKAIFEKYAN
jgi:RHH-type rel operon transcriptional repressor/antitoxin RelB